MESQFNTWKDVNKLGIEKVLDLVYTGGSLQHLITDSWLPQIIGDPNTPKLILDFGCGVGRNIFGLAQEFKTWDFYGYDNANMIEKANEYSMKKFNKTIQEYSNIKITTDWDVLKAMKFDCIYATLVFQHIYEKDLNVYLKDIKQMTPRLIVSGRRFNDDRHKNTWKILENNGYHPSQACLRDMNKWDPSNFNYSVEGEPCEHITCLYEMDGKAC